MKKNSVYVWGQCAVLAAVMVAAGGCFKLDPIPVTLPRDVEINLGTLEGPMEFTIDAGAAHSFQGLPEEIPPGIVVPFPDQNSDQMPLTTFPSEQEIKDMVDDEIQGIDVTNLDLSEIALQRIIMTATTENDFSDLTSVRMYYMAKGEAATRQNEEDGILIGSATNESGFGAQIVLEAPTGDAAVNFMTLIRENDANPEEGYPTAYMRVEGTVPTAAEAPTWSTQVVVTADGTMAIETDPFEFCDMPSQTYITDLIAEYADDMGIPPNLAVNFASVTQLELLSAKLIASGGSDFSDLTELHLYYTPKTGATIELGGASAPNGFGSRITLTPPTGQTVDFLELIEANDASTGGGCPGVYMTVEGNIPENLPSFTTEVDLNVYVRVGLF